MFFPVTTQQKGKTTQHNLHKTRVNLSGIQTHNICSFRKLSNHCSLKYRYPPVMETCFLISHLKSLFPSFSDLRLRGGRLGSIKIDIPCLLWHRSRKSTTSLAVWVPCWMFPHVIAIEFRLGLHRFCRFGAYFSFDAGIFFRYW